MSEFIMGTAVERDGALRILPDFSTIPLKKNCPAPAGLALSAGQRVLLLQYGGTYLVVNAYPSPV